MAKDGEGFEKWLKGANIPRGRLSPEQVTVLQKAFAFLEDRGRDYSSVRIVAHFLLHCELGLKKVQIARLLNVTPATVWCQNKLSSREVVREIQHRLSGRPYGKLLPRFAGPIAEFLLTHPEATRSDVLDFIERTWQIQVTLVALHNFLKTYGLDRASCRGHDGGRTRHGRFGHQRAGVDRSAWRTGCSGTALARAAPGIFFGHTQYAGAFLLLPQVLHWWEIAQQCFSDDYGSLQRGFLTSVFMPVVGLERVFHLEPLDDPGFEVLSGATQPKVAAEK